MLKPKASSPKKGTCPPGQKRDNLFSRNKDEKLLQDSFSVALHSDQSCAAELKQPKKPLPVTAHQYNHWHAGVFWHLS